MKRSKKSRAKKIDASHPGVSKKSLKPTTRSRVNQNRTLRNSLEGTEAKTCSDVFSNEDGTEGGIYHMDVEESPNQQSHSSVVSHPMTLIEVAASGSVEKLKCLLQNGASVNQVDGEKNTALMKAAQAGHLACLDLLIQHKAALNLKNKYKQRALTLACSSGSLPCVERLLEAGAKVDTLSKFGADLLKTVLDSENWHIFNFLATAKVFTKGNLVEEMYKAIENNKLAPLQYIAKCLGPDCLNKNLLKSHTPLEYSAIHNFVDSVSTLMPAGENIDFQVLQTFSFACQLGKTEFCQQLLPYFTNLNFQGSKGQTALWSATDKGLVDIVQLLLKAGALTEISDNRGITPLLCACINRNRSIVEILLSAGSNINHRDCIEGDSALAWASKNNDVPLIKFLLNSGANIESEDKHGNTALCIACELDCLDVVKVLVEFGANLAHTNKLGCTPVMLAATELCEKSLAYLLSLKVNVNHQDIYGRTAIMLASKVKHLSDCWLRSAGTAFENCFEMLLEAGADPSIRDEDGMALLEETVLSNTDYFAVRDISGGSYYRMYKMRSLLRRLITKNVYLGRKFHRMILLGQDTINFAGEGRISLIDVLQNCQVQPSLEIFDADDDLYGVGWSGRGKEKQLTPLQCAFYARRRDLILFFVDNLFLHWQDVFPITRKNLYIDEPIKPYAEQLYSQPWTLRSLSFIKVSTCLGFGSERKSRVQASGLPPTLQRQLLFEQFKTKKPDQGVEKPWSAVHIAHGLEPTEFLALHN